MKEVKGFKDLELIMPESLRGCLAAPELNTDHLTLALAYAAMNAVRNHRRSNVPLVYWDRQEHKVIEISPFDVPLPEDPPVVDTTTPGHQTYLRLIPSSARPKPVPPITDFPKED